MGCVQYSKHPRFHGRLKHVDIAHQFVRDYVNKGLLQVSHIPTSEMAADVLTKPLPRSKHDECQHLIGLTKESSSE